MFDTALCRKGAAPRLKSRNTSVLVNITQKNKLGRLQTMETRCPIRLSFIDVGLMHTRLLLAAMIALLAMPAAAAANDYPTSVRVDFVIGCMAANNSTHEAMLKCSCAIDAIAELMPYADYEMAETALSMQAGTLGGDRAGLFREPPQMKAILEELRRAQAEANLQCFR